MKEPQNYYQNIWLLHNFNLLYYKIDLSAFNELSIRFDQTNIHLNYQAHPEIYNKTQPKL